jgi:hypothetical protein
MISCHHRDKSMSFYYWRTAFSPDSVETKTLRDNAVQTLYVRYFDVDWTPQDSAPVPLAPIRFKTPVQGYSIIPVVFIKNRVFEQLDSSAVPAFAARILAQIRMLNTAGNIDTRETQFDCDWTHRTKDRYFSFLRAYRAASGAPVSATIRLHQVKYPDQTGIPPIDHGVLMYYNMGDIDAGGGRSIYDKNIAHRYTPSLRTYPLTLDIALPIFSWGLQVRDGKVIQLLDKMNAALFDADTNFTRTSPNRYTAKHACFKSGYYFRETDMAKLESIPADDLLDIVADVNRHSNHRIRNLIFYDLDRQNLQLYDQSIFKEVLAHTD